MWRAPFWSGFTPGSSEYLREICCDATGAALLYRGGRRGSDGHRHRLPFDMGVTDPVERVLAGRPPAAERTVILTVTTAALFGLSASPAPNSVPFTTL